MNLGKRLVVIVIGLFVAKHAFAFDPFVVKDIRVEGIQRVEAGTVFSYLPVKVGDTITDEKASQAIRSLFATGFFKDVSLEVENGVLIINIQERPSVAQIEINGAKEFNKTDLLKGMRSMGLSEGLIFDRALLDKAEQELKRQYVSRGKYAVQVVITTTPLERNRVSVRFDIVEGDVAKIRQISIIGGGAYKESELLEIFKLRTPGLMTWYTKNDQYSKQKLAGDIEALKTYYLDRGYLEFNVDSTQVSITPDKKDVYISIGITEGGQFSVVNLNIAGEILLPRDEALKLVLLKPGEIFSRTKLTESTKAISDRLGNDGYAFANVNAVPEIDREKRNVSFTLFVDPGRRVYVRRINLAGNTRTRDEVIRREMRQIEAGWYSAEKITKSKQRVDRLGYFNEVNVETPSVSGATDQVDVNISVVEKPTGNIMLGAGYGSSEGVILSGGVSQNNVFGTGNFIGLQVNTSKLNTIYSLSFTQPYWTVDGVSRGFDIYKRNFNPTAIGAGQYSTKTLGANGRIGMPFTDIDNVSLGLGYEETNITTFDGSPDRILSYVATFGNLNTAVPATIGWVRDTRDSGIYTTRGGTQRGTLEVGVPGGTLHYYKIGYQNQRYYPLTSTMTLYLNGDIGIGGGLDDRPLPFFKNYFLGGVNSVRGFTTATIGPKYSDGTPIGGSRKIMANAELLFPFPGMANDKSVRFGPFFDSGVVGEQFIASDLRASVGVGITWVSPFGPIKISMANAIRSQVGDGKQKFQFTFGQMF